MNTDQAEARKEYLVIVEKGEDGMLTAYAPQLPGCHTCGDDLPEVLANIRDAIELYLEDEDKDFVLPEIVDILRVAV
jgi:predicted RNase H-like HicB family nuclease